MNPQERAKAYAADLDDYAGLNWLVSAYGVGIGSEDGLYTQDWFREGFRKMAAQAEELPMLMDYGEGCQVCAKGALFTARLDRLGGVTLRQGVSLNRKDPSEYLSLFDAKDLYLIEVAFEGQPTSSVPEDITDEEVYEAKRFSLAVNRLRTKEYSRAEARMRAIMKNIIRNKGRFKAKDLRGLA